MKKRFLALGMAVTFLLAGCGGNSTNTEAGVNTETETKTETQTENLQAQETKEGEEENTAEGTGSSVMTKNADGTEITSWSWDAPEFNAKIEEYVKEAAGVTVNGQTMGREDLISKLTVASATGKGMPDCFKLGNTDIPRLVEQNAIKDMTELVEPFKDLLPQVAWDMVTYQGKIWGIPANSPAGGMFYRYEVLEKYGIDPESLTTWDKWIEAGQKITSESNGEIAWTAAPKGKLGITIYWPVFQQYRAEIISNDSKVTINSEEYRKGLELLKKIKDSGITIDMDEWTAPWYQSMKDGTIACYPSGTWFVQTLIQQAPDTKGKWYFVPYPTVEEGGDRYPNFGNTSCFISSNTKNEAAAFEWCKAWTLDETGSLEIGLKELGVSVVSNTALENEYVQSPHEYFAKEQQYWKIATQAVTNSTYFTPFLPESTEADAIWGRYFEKWWIGELSSNEALSKAEEELKTKLKLE